MTYRRATPSELLDRTCSPSEFLIQSWVVAVMILGVVVILLTATLTMLG